MVGEAPERKVQSKSCYWVVLGVENPRRRYQDGMI